MSEDYQEIIDRIKKKMDKEKRGVFLEVAKKIAKFGQGYMERYLETCERLTNKSALEWFVIGSSRVAKFGDSELFREYLNISMEIENENVIIGFAYEIPYVNDSEKDVLNNYLDLWNESLRSISYVAKKIENTAILDVLAFGTGITIKQQKGILKNYLNAWINNIDNINEIARHIKNDEILIEFVEGIHEVADSENTLRAYLSEWKDNLKDINNLASKIGNKNILNVFASGIRKASVYGKGYVRRYLDIVKRIEDEDILEKFSESIQKIDRNNIEKYLEISCNVENEKLLDKFADGVVQIFKLKINPKEYIEVWENNIEKINRIARRAKSDSVLKWFVYGTEWIPIHNIINRSIVTFSQSYKINLSKYLDIWERSIDKLNYISEKIKEEKIMDMFAKNFVYIVGSGKNPEQYLAVLENNVGRIGEIARGIEERKLLEIFAGGIAYLAEKYSEKLVELENKETFIYSVVAGVRNEIDIDYARSVLEKVSELKNLGYNQLGVVLMKVLKEMT